MLYTTIHIHNLKNHTDSHNKNTEDNIKMLEFFIDIIFIEFLVDW